MRHRLIVSLLLAAVLGGMGGRAAANSVHPFTLDELTYVADRIVIGTVLTTDAGFTPDARVILTRVELDVSDVLKGPADLATQVVTVLGGEDQGVVMVVEGAPSFEPGETVLVFLEELDQGFSVLGWQQGKFSVEYSAALGTEVARLAPAGSTGRAWSLQALRAAIGEDVRTAHVPAYREIPGLLPHKRAAFRAHWGLPAQEVGR